MVRVTGVSRLVIGLLMTILGTSMAVAASVPRMTTDELNSRLGEEHLVVLDARTSGDYQRATQKIAGSVRVDPANVGSWYKDYGKEQTIVLYCS